VDPKDLYLAHIAGIDTLARALLAAESVIKEKRLATLRDERYSGWNGGLGKKILAGEYTLAALADHAVKSGLDPKPRSGKQELCENIIAGACKF
jgi:xylose isomerase